MSLKTTPDMLTINNQWEEQYAFLETDYEKALKHNRDLRIELKDKEEEISRLEKEINLLRNPPRRKIGDRGKQKTLHYRVVNNNTGEENLFHTMKDISEYYGMSSSGINQHIRNWKIKKFNHLDIFYLKK